MTKREVLEKATGRCPSGWAHRIYQDKNNSDKFMYWFTDENSDLIDNKCWRLIIASDNSISEAVLDEYIGRANGEPWHWVY